MIVNFTKIIAKHIKKDMTRFDTAAVAFKNTGKVKEF
jgi:hypothetical protein